MDDRQPRGGDGGGEERQPRDLPPEQNALEVDAVEFSKRLWATRWPDEELNELLLRVVEIVEETMRKAGKRFHKGRPAQAVLTYSSDGDVDGPAGYFAMQEVNGGGSVFDGPAFVINNSRNTSLPAFMGSATYPWAQVSLINERMLYDAIVGSEPGAHIGVLLLFRTGFVLPEPGFEFIGFRCDAAVRVTVEDNPDDFNGFANVMQALNDFVNGERNRFLNRISPLPSITPRSCSLCVHSQLLMAWSRAVDRERKHRLGYGWRRMDPEQVATAPFRCPMTLLVSRFCVASPENAGVKLMTSPGAEFVLPSEIRSRRGLVRLRPNIEAWRDAVAVFHSSADGSAVVVWIALTNFTEVPGATSVEQVLTTMAPVIRSARDRLYGWVVGHMAFPGDTMPELNEVSQRNIVVSNRRQLPLQPAAPLPREVSAFSRISDDFLDNWIRRADAFNYIGLLDRVEWSDEAVRRPFRLDVDEGDGEEEEEHTIED